MLASTVTDLANRALEAAASMRHRRPVLACCEMPALALLALPRRRGSASRGRRLTVAFAPAAQLERQSSSELRARRLRLRGARAPGTWFGRCASVAAILARTTAATASFLRAPRPRRRTR